MRISQILGNLLSNAIKFTDSGSVTLRIKLDEMTAPATLTVMIEDTGVGFDEAQSAYLFSRFHQADETISRRFGGTGLGLAICQSLAQMMGGEVLATSEPSVGSSFKVVFPLLRAESIAAYDERVTTHERAPAPLCGPASA